jgi:hypothetical protein
MRACVKGGFHAWFKLGTHALLSRLKLRITNSFKVSSKSIRGSVHPETTGIPANTTTKRNTTNQKRGQSADKHTTPWHLPQQFYPLNHERE